MSVSKQGKVYLVGAGPGDPGLLTLRGLECLERADLILYDGLVNPLLLRHAKGEAVRTCRSGGPEGRFLKQDEINERLIAAARAGQTVVRLKGGDPFMFGRGAEEAAALADAGIEYEVVPGITAATAAGAYAGISLTHRRFASAVAFITGHEDPAKEQTTVDYKSLAAFSGTLVFYMGLHRLEAIVSALIEAGKNPQTPACVIGRATTPEQRTVVAPLGDLPQQVRSSDVRAPSLIVIGECVRLREQIAWFEKRPLFGKRIGITRPASQADAVIAKALELGAQPVLLPTIEILPPEDWTEVDATLKNLDRFDWLVFTSVNGVNGLLGRLWETGGDVRPRVGLDGGPIMPETADALLRYRLRADLVPHSFRAEALADSLKPYAAGKRVLWARASRGRDVLPRELEAAGAAVELLVVYRNEDVGSFSPGQRALLERGDVDWVGLSSPSIARSFKSLLTPAALSQVGRRIKLASISPVTSQAAREVGLPIAAEAETYTWDGLFEAIIAADHNGPSARDDSGPERRSAER